MDEFTTPPSLASYSKLLADIRQLITEGHRRIERFIDTQTVVTNWQAGRGIYRHLQEDHSQKDYHSTFYRQLAEDLDVSVRFLQNTARFYELYPQLDESLPLNWTHYTALISLPDAAARDAWMERIVAEDLSATAFKQLLRDERRLEASPASEKMDAPERGQVYLYRVIKVNTLHSRSEVLVDLGFDTEFTQPSSVEAEYRSGDMVVSLKEADGNYRLSTMPERRERLFTYKAAIERVIDGDTIKVLVDLGFGARTRQNLRFRGIDTAALYLQDGQDAKRFVEAELGRVPFVVIKTYSHDLYDRYLVDVFYKPGCEDVHEVAETGVYLNAVLVEKGYAKRWGE